MDGIAKRVKNSGYIVRYFVRQFKGIKGWDDQVLSKGTGTIHAYALSITTQMAPTGSTIAAVAARYMAFATNSVTNLKAIHFLTHVDHFADIFMTRNQAQWYILLRPVIPVINVNIGATNSRFFYFFQ